MTKPLTGYEKEIAILHAEARLDSELIEEFKGQAYEYKQAIERVRELHRPTKDGRSCIECSRIICLGTPNGLGGIQYPCLTIAILDGFADEA